MGMGADLMEDLMIANMAHEMAMEDRISKKEWRTNDGRVIKISAMETSHIMNTLKWMERNGFEYQSEYKRLFTQELNRRKGGEGI